MNKYSKNDLLEYAETTKKYIKMFGEDSCMMYVGEITEATKIYKECIEKGKPYEELYGKMPEDAIY